jgi:hypothetical protein
MLVSAIPRKGRDETGDGTNPVSSPARGIHLARDAMYGTEISVVVPLRRIEMEVQKSKM